MYAIKNGFHEKYFRHTNIHSAKDKNKNQKAYIKMTEDIQKAAIFKQFDQARNIKEQVDVASKIDGWIIVKVEQVNNVYEEKHIISSGLEG